VGPTREATVRILDVSGRLLPTLQETDGNGGVQWDLRDESGKKAVGKLAVVR
jgi:hypothetical protein